MSAINDGGPAFPHPDYLAAGWHGMTLRDYFAAKALPAVIAAVSAGQHDAGSASGAIGGRPEGRIASDAYAVADAMLKAREVQP